MAKHTSWIDGLAGFAAGTSPVLPDPDADVVLVLAALVLAAFAPFVLAVVVSPGLAPLPGSDPAATADAPADDEPGAAPESREVALLAACSGVAGAGPVFEPQLASTKQATTTTRSIMRAPYSVSPAASSY